MSFSSNAMAINRLVSTMYIFRLASSRFKLSPTLGSVAAKQTLMTRNSSSQKNALA